MYLIVLFVSAKKLSFSRHALARQLIMRLSLPRTALSVLQRQSRSSPSARSLLSTLGATAPAASAAPPAAEIKAPADISTDLVEATRRPNEVVAPYQVSVSSQYLIRPMFDEFAKANRRWMVLLLCVSRCLAS
jgi:hypothetical protein